MILDVALVGPGRFRKATQGPARNLMEGALYSAALRYAEARFDQTYLLIPERGIVLPDAQATSLTLTLLDLGPAWTFFWASQVVASLKTRHPVTYLSIQIFASALYTWPLRRCLEQEVLPYWDWKDPLEELSYEGRIRWFQQQEY